MYLVTQVVDRLAWRLEGTPQYWRLTSAFAEAWGRVMKDQLRKQIVHADLAHYNLVAERAEGGR